jgi:GntR family transcriptional regulator/MocR family aminotransferase
MSQKTPVLFVQARKDRAKPLFRQVAEQIRTHISAGILPAGEKLPGVRTLARQLNVSEDTVSQAYATLAEQGIIEARPRSGYFVSGRLAATGASPHPGIRQTFPAGLPARNALRIEEARRFAALPAGSCPEAVLLAGRPEHEEGGMKGWVSEAVRFAKSPWLLGSGAFSCGLPALRSAIAGRLRERRGISCGADSIILTTGFRQSLSLSLSLLFTPGESVLVESPCAPFIASQLYACALNAVGCKVDGEGLAFSEEDPRLNACRGAVLTPACQMPLGVALARRRKKQLLIWARTSGAMLIECDEGSEFPETDTPEMPLKAAPFGDECVVYCGGFSLAAPPAAGVGFIVAPKGLESAFAGAAALAGAGPSLLEQRALAAYLQSEAPALHERRMTLLARERRAALRDLFARMPESVGRLAQAASGAWLSFVLAPEFAGIEPLVLKALSREDLPIVPLSSFAHAAGAVHGFAFNCLCLSLGELMRDAEALIRAIGENCGGRTV